MKIVSFALVLAVARGVPITCWSNSTADWDTANTCGTVAVNGREDACGDALQDLCHMTLRIDALRDATACGKCYSLSYGTGPTVKYAKVIGVEEAAGTYAYRLNKLTAEAIQSGITCGTASTESVTIAEVECPPEATCIEAGGDWDPESTHGCGGTPPGDHAACGGTWDDPCTVTQAFPTGAENKNHCGKCVMFTLADDSEVRALVVGSETGVMWDYRFNKDFYDDKLGGDAGDTCGAFELVKQMKSVEDVECPSKATCFLDADTDWDEASHCQGDAFKGGLLATCGDSSADPCHLTQTFDDTDHPDPGAPGSCGQCVKITYKIAGAGADVVKFGKVVGAEEVTGGNRSWEYRLNKALVDVIKGSGATCETDTEDILVEAAACPPEVTCWANGTDAEGWDPDNTCTGVTDLPVPMDDFDCGTEAKPCTVTEAFDTAPLDTKHCGTCVTITYDDSQDLDKDLNVDIHTVVIGGEVTKKWKYRMNSETYKAVRGSGQCGEAHSIAAVKSTETVECPSMKATCFDEDDADWDPLNHCQDANFKGEQNAACGETKNDPCHLVATYDDGSYLPPDAPGKCGKCVKMTYKVGGRNIEKFGKIVGAEKVTGRFVRRWEYRISKALQEAIEDNPNCGAGTVDLKVEDEECPVEVTCWDDGEDGAAWDPDTTCTDVDLPDPEEADDCGMEAKPCTVTQAFDTAPQDTNHCGKCVKITYDDTLDADADIIAVVIGGEVTKKWKYRMNAGTHVKLGGTASTCGDAHEVAAVKSMESVECPGDDDVTKVTCFDENEADWDEEDHCQDDPFKGVQSATCGVTVDDPCHLVATYDDGSNTPPAAPGDCGKCLKMTYGSPEVVKYGKIMGAEQVTSRFDRLWEYRMSKALQDAIKGSAAYCGTDTEYIKFEDADCAVEVTCWANSTNAAGWDPVGTCSAVPDLQAPEEDLDCGTAEKPCTVTQAFDATPGDTSHCGKCVKITYEDAVDADVDIIAVVIGAEVTKKWKYRMNSETYKAIGDGEYCGAAHEVAAVKNAESVECPVDDDVTKVTCFAHDHEDWDEEDHCQDDPFKGVQSATCGVTKNDPCHLVATYDDDSNAPPTAPGDCGKCVKMTYKAGGAGEDVVKFGKIVGAELVTSRFDRLWEYRMSKDLQDVIKGSAATCGTDIEDIKVEDEDCADEVTCWEDGTNAAGWDPNITCDGVTVPAPEEAEDCGTEAKPCTVTQAFDTAPEDTNHCGKCVKITYESGLDADVEIIAVVIGGEVTKKWKYRMNAKTHVKLGGAVGTCGAAHEVAAVKSADSEPCPTAPPTDAPTTDGPAAGWVKMTCYSDGNDDWDRENYCSTEDDNVLVGTHLCGVTKDDPCHLAATFDETNPPPTSPQGCGRCVTMTYADGMRMRHAKIIGMERVGSRRWDFRVNKATFEDMLGAPGTCGVDTADAMLIEDDCGLEMTCWVDGGTSALWDPDDTCAGVANLRRPTDCPCGESASNPCTLTMGFTSLPPNTDHCGKCVVVKYEDDFGEEAMLHGVIIGGEVTYGWNYRSNKDTYENKLGGTGVCGAYHDTIRIISTSDPVNCEYEADVTCYDDGIPDWDTDDRCSDDDVQGKESPCGDTQEDPCHLVVTHNGRGIIQPKGRCGECLKMTYRPGGVGHRVRYGKIIGAETRPEQRWDYRVNQMTMDEIRGSRAACWTDVETVQFEKVDCPIEISCVHEGCGTHVWDPSGSCSGVVGLPPPSDAACGADGLAPCTVTQAFPLGPSDSSHCGKCVTIERLDGDVETEVNGIIIGGEESAMWSFRVNRHTYVRFGGSGECGAHHEVVPVHDVSDASCT